MMLGQQCHSGTAGLLQLLGSGGTAGLLRFLGSGFFGVVFCVFFCVVFGVVFGLDWILGFLAFFWVSGRCVF